MRATSRPGVDLRQDFAPTSIYFRLRDARAQARDAERQADTEGGDEALPALWRPVATMAIGALKSTSEDLEVATWLTEALVRMAGLRGLMAGAAVIGGLVERHWDGLFPMPGGGRHGGPRGRRSGTFLGQGTDGTLMQPLRKVALFRRPDGSPFSLWQYQAAVELSGITDPGAARPADRLRRPAVRGGREGSAAAGATHWSAQRELITKTLASWKEMERVFRRKGRRREPGRQPRAATCWNSCRKPAGGLHRPTRQMEQPEMTSATAGDGAAGCCGDAREHHRTRAGAAPALGDCRLVQAQRAELADRVYAG